MRARQLAASGVMAMLALSAPRLAGAQSAPEMVTDPATGVQYQVTRQLVPRQIPVTEPREQQQTTYRQQVTTENVPHQQNYIVPVTQYQLVSELHGRWNPFVTPHWTHRYVPVTTWQQQAATVQIPVTRVAWAPETKTVQSQVTTYRTVNQEVVIKTPIGMATGGAGSTTALASARPLSQAPQPSATLRASSVPAVASAAPIGGQRMTADPPKEATGWQPLPSRYDATDRR